MNERSTAIPLARCSQLLPVVEFVRGVGASEEGDACRAGLPVRGLRHPELLVPAERLWRFYSLVARSESIPDLAAIAMRRASLNRFFPLIGAELLRAPTLFRVLVGLRTRIAAETSNLQLMVRQRPSELLLTASRTAVPREAQWQADLLTIVLLTRLVRLAVPGWHPSRLWVRSPATGPRRRTLEAMGGEAIQFDREGPGIAIARELLPLPVRRPSSFPLPRESHAIPPAKDLAGSLQQVVEAYRRDGWLSISEAAEIAGMSVRSLQYRLAEQATTYSQVVERARMRLAADALATTDQRLAAIARDLGFSTHANFSRAFQRWAGVSPSEFRLRRAYRDPLGLPVPAATEADVSLASVSSLP